MTDFDTQRRQQNMIVWLETEALKHGTENQRERWAAEVLPEEEILRLARAELFKGFEDTAIKRWHTNEVRREMRAALKHKGARYSVGDSCHLIPEFEVADVGELGAGEWSTLKKLESLVIAVGDHPWMFRSGAKATLTTFTHWATCLGCGVELARSGVKVSIPWAGRVLVREFCL